MAYDNDRFYDMETLTFLMKRSWSLAIVKNTIQQ